MQWPPDHDCWEVNWYHHPFADIITLEGTVKMMSYDLWFISQDCRTLSYFESCTSCKFMTLFANRKHIDIYYTYPLKTNISPGKLMFGRWTFPSKMVPFLRDICSFSRGVCINIPGNPHPINPKAELAKMERPHVGGGTKAEGKLPMNMNESKKHHWVSCNFDDL